METSTLEIREGSFEEVIDKLSLLEEHWQEVAKNKHLMVLKPDYEKYKAMEDAGALLSLIAYENNEVVGYSINFLTNHIHYADLLTCYNDVLFVKLEKRKSPLGLRLIGYTERAAREKGAKLMLWHAKQNTALDSILSNRRLNVQEIVYSKEL